MSVPRSKLNAQGRVTVPVEIRRKLGIGPGSVLEWHHEGNAVVVRKPRYTFEDIRSALFKERPKTRTLEELKEGVADYIRDKHTRR